jgi:hypothetical protein
VFHQAVVLVLQVTLLHVQVAMAVKVLFVVAVVQ